MPRAEIVDKLRMVLHEIMMLDILFVSFFDSFEVVVVWVKIVARSNKSGGREANFFWEVLFKEELKHSKNYYKFKTGEINSSECCKSIDSTKISHHWLTDYNLRKLKFLKMIFILHQTQLSRKMSFYNFTTSNFLNR